MYTLRSKAYSHQSEKFVDGLVGIFIFLISIIPFLIHQIGDAIFSFLSNAAMSSGISDGRDAMGFAMIVMIIFFSLPIATGVITYLISRQRKFIFVGFLVGLAVAFLVWIKVTFF